MRPMVFDRRPAHRFAAGGGPSSRRSGTRPCPSARIVQLDAAAPLTRHARPGR